MIVPGHRRRQRLQRWELDQRIDAPPDGNGFIVVGSLLLGGGGLRLISEAVSVAAFDQPAAPISIVGGALQVAGGTASLAVGLVRRKRFRTWHSGRGFTAQPYGAPLRGGATFGVAGRF